MDFAYRCWFITNNGSIVSGQMHNGHRLPRCCCKVHLEGHPVHVYVCNFTFSKLNAFLWVRGLRV